MRSSTKKITCEIGGLLSSPPHLCGYFMPTIRRISILWDKFVCPYRSKLKNEKKIYLLWSFWNWKKKRPRSHSLNNTKDSCLQCIQKKGMNDLSATAKTKFALWVSLLVAFFFFVQRMMLLMTPVHKSIQSPHRRHTLKLGLSFCHFNNAMHFIGVWPNLWRTDGEQEWKTGWKKNDKMNAYPYSGVAIVQQHADKIIIAIILLMMMMKTMESYATLYPRC